MCYRAAPTYGALAHTAVWSIAVLFTVIPASLEYEGLGNVTYLPPTVLCTVYNNPPLVCL